MIHCHRVAIRAADFHLQNVSLTVPAGAYGVLMGRTGSGKTTLLEAICGLRPVTKGVIELGGRDVTSLRPADRQLGYVPQEGALFPRMTVQQNLGFSLSVAGRPASEVQTRTQQLAEQLSISHLLGRYPVALSGGEQQRVALGRALAARPAVLLLDEPLAALDESTRTQMIALLREVHATTHTTTLHVTHSQAEAEALGDMLLELDAGKLHERKLRPKQP